MISSQLSVLSTYKADPLNCTVDRYRNPRSYLGCLFEQKISEFKTELPSSQTEERNLRQRCKNLPISPYKQIKQILPDNLTLLKNVSIFSVTNVLQPVKDLTKYCRVMQCLGISGNILHKAES